MKLYHIAVPKTATESLQKSMKDANLDIYITMKDEPTINYVEAASHKIISGHFHYGLHKLISPRESSKYITVLRNPLERAISDYYHHKRIGTEWVKSLTLKDFLDAVPENIMSVQLFGFGIKNYHDAISILNTDYAIVGCFDNLIDFYKSLSNFLDIKLQMLVLNTGIVEPYELGVNFQIEFIKKHKLDYMIYEKIYKAGVFVK